MLKAANDCPHLRTHVSVKKLGGSVMNRKMDNVTWLSALALVTASAGCSAGTSGTGGFGGTDTTGSAGGGSGSTAASSGGGSNGASAGSSKSGAGSSGGSHSGSNTAPSSGSSSAGSGASSGSGATGSGSGSAQSSGSGSAASGSGSGSGSSSSGSAMNGRGCGQGTSCTPGTDLAAPASTDGFQIVIPNGLINVQPGAEGFWCYYKNIPVTSAINVGKFQSWMTTGSSHHFITFSNPTASQTDGALVSCAIGTGTWVYATSVSGQVIELKLPDGVGLPMPATTQLTLNLHVLNAGSTANSPTLKLNVYYAQNVQYQAGTMTSFNTGISVPPGTAAAPGTQTVSGTCTAPVGSNFFLMTTHTHKHAVATDVNYIHNGQTQNIVHTTDYQSPDVGVWNAPNFLTVQAGDSFTYSCAYQNTSATTITVGETAAYNEMCMAIGYYFPAGTTSCL